MKTESSNLNCSCQENNCNLHILSHTIELLQRQTDKSRKYPQSNIWEFFLANYSFIYKKQNCTWQHIAYLFSHKNLAFMHKSNEMWYNMIIAFCWYAHIRLFYAVIVCLLSNIKTWQQNSYVKLSYECDYKVWEP